MCAVEMIHMLASVASPKRTERGAFGSLGWGAHTTHSRIGMSVSISWKSSTHVIVVRRIPHVVGATPGISEVSRGEEVPGTTPKTAILIK